VIQGLCWCEVADEPVVVINAQPVKPSNGVEGKTEQTISIQSGGADRGQKRYLLRRGEVIFMCMKSMESRHGLTSVPTGTDTAEWRSRNVDAAMMG
jgi:hypothetical protein